MMDAIKLVLPPGLEPGRPKSQDFKSCVSTYSTMGALAIPEGLEPSTCRLEVCCSIQLSYGTIQVKLHFAMQKTKT